MTRVFQCRNPHCSNDRPGPFARQFPLIVQWTNESLRECPHCGSTAITDEGTSEMTWQQEHERLMDEMAWKVGAHANTSGAIRKALKNVTDPVTLLEYEELNRMNTEACEKAERER